MDLTRMKIDNMNSTEICKYLKMLEDFLIYFEYVFLHIFKINTITYFI